MPRLQSVPLIPSIPVILRVTSKHLLTCLLWHILSPGPISSSRYWTLRLNFTVYWIWACIVWCELAQPSLPVACLSVFVYILCEWHLRRCHHQTPTFQQESHVQSQSSDPAPILLPLGPTSQWSTLCIQPVNGFKQQQVLISLWISMHILILLIIGGLIGWTVLRMIITSVLGCSPHQCVL
jgi:hypothetical protein